MFRFISNFLFIQVVVYLNLSLLSVVSASMPNIVVVVCDDLGYGDVQCLNPDRGKIPTPGIDRLANEGMIFTDAHSGSSVCTPTRYGLLTGRYSWRTRLQSGVTQGFAPCFIAEDRPTVASYLKSQGYQTALIGKWHLNFLYQDPTTGETLKRKDKKALPPLGSKIPDGPVNRGFDYFHGFHHAREMKCVIENDTVILYDEEINMLPRLTNKAVKYIDSHKALKEESPFFLYVPFGSPHTPILPTKEWQGKSGLGAYADFVMQTDDGFARILEALDRNGFSENTLVIFTSDNGCSKVVDIPNLEKQGHYPSAWMRGSKADLWDGGHRVPFLVRWPGIVEAGVVSNQLICLTDLFATCSDILQIDMPDNCGEDSVSFLPALQGIEIRSSRNGVVHHSISGHFGYRQASWKLLLSKGSGGWTAPREKAAVKNNSPIAQLYDLESDPSESTNLFEVKPDIANQLIEQLESDVWRGRSTDGPEAQNDTEEIELWKSGRN